MSAPGLTAKLALAAAYLRTRVLASVLTSRARIERWQGWRVARLRRHAIARISFYQRRVEVPFSQFPIIEKSDVMSAFEAFNVLGLTSTEAWRRLEQEDPPAGYDLGCSTGTSGNRGLYLVSDRERFIWLGTIVAKAIPDVLRRRHRVAIVLPRASRLYDAANESRLLKLEFFDLSHGLPDIAGAMAAFQPTIVVAPPKVLRWMAENAVSIQPERMFSAAEILDAPDRSVIEDHFKLELGQIYMATEGLFGVTCERGTLHLAEDTVRFEFEPAGDGLVSPIVTDFTRRSQVMARYRMNDLLRLSARRCPCGSALQPVDEVVGRRDDCFELPGQDGQVLVTPDVLRNAIVGTDPRIDDFRLYQTGRNAVELVLPTDLPIEIASAARQALVKACIRLGASPEVILRREDMAVNISVKLRRVERRWRAS